jgi:CRP/FNR family cyclic AMP-dependent transcriptional regulator
MVIKREGLFDPKSFLAQVGEGHSVGKYSKDHVVYTQGESCDAIFYLQSGKAKLTVVSTRGKEAVVAIVSENEFFGEGGLSGQPLRTATVRTLTDSIIVRLEKPAFLRVFRQEPAFANFLCAISWLELSGSKAILSTNFSIRAKSAWPACSFCWQTSARKVNRSRFWRK